MLLVRDGQVLDHPVQVQSRSSPVCIPSDHPVPRKCKQKFSARKDSVFTFQPLGCKGIVVTQVGVR